MIWTALTIGFAGSLHCLGMCSPLAIAVTGMSPSIILSRLFYNLGRILTYGVMGSVIATIGMAFPLVKYQNLLSIILGISFLVIAVAGVSSFRVPFLSKALGRFSTVLKTAFSRILQRRGHATTFLLGSLNGILPCGLSFLALTYCLTLAGPADGFGFMIWFGIGTLPVMIGLTGIFHWLIARFHLNVKNITTAILVISGIILIARTFIIHLPHVNSIEEGMIDIVLCR